MTNFAILTNTIMPVEQTDNTRVELSPRINPLKPIKVH